MIQSLQQFFLAVKIATSLNYADITVSKKSCIGQIIMTEGIDLHAQFGATGGNAGNHLKQRGVGQIVNGIPQNQQFRAWACGKIQYGTELT